MVDQDRRDDQDVPRLEGDLLTCSTGVVLRIKTPPSMAAAEAMLKVGKGRPKPPMVFIKDKSREEENPNDPDYKAALGEWIAMAVLRALRTLIPVGSEFVSKPDDMVHWDDEDYLDLMEAMVLDPGKGRFTKYVQWVLNVACVGEDLGVLSNELMRRIGVREEDVREAQQLFRSLAPLGADSDVPGDGGGGLGDQISGDDPGSGTGVRRTASG